MMAVPTKRWAGRPALFVLTLVVCLAWVWMIDLDSLKGSLSRVVMATTSSTKFECGGYDLEAAFLDTAKSLLPVTDKVTGGERGHDYQVMYGQLLLPHYLFNPNMKMLEIGLGCDMGYGPGASVKLWEELFPQAEKWEAEYNAACVEKHVETGKLDGGYVLVGDQGDPATLDSWIEKTHGANFDIVIDDGGHQQCQIWTTFQKLWPRLHSGGIYFIEDLHVSRRDMYNEASSPICEKGFNVVDQMKDIASVFLSGNNVGDIANVRYMYFQKDAVAIGKIGEGDDQGITKDKLLCSADAGGYSTEVVFTGKGLNVSDIDGLLHRQRPGIKFIYCEVGSCVIGRFEGGASSAL
jgi:hypothetical protein